MADPISDERLRTIVDGRYFELDLEEGIAIATELLAARAEVERLRADSSEAMELLRAHGQPPDWLEVNDAVDWNLRYGELLLRHKETP